MTDCRLLPFTMILMWNSKQKSFECFPQVCIFMAISQLRLKQLKSLKRKFTSLSRLKRSSPLKYLSPDLYAIPKSVFSTCLHAYEFCYLILIHHMERGTSDWPFCFVYSERHHRKLKFALESEKPRIRQWSLPVIFSFA